MRFQDGYPLVVFLLLTALVILAKIAGSPAEAATSAPKSPLDKFTDTTSQMKQDMDRLEQASKKWNTSVDELDTEVGRVAAHLL